MENKKELILVWLFIALGISILFVLYYTDEFYKLTGKVIKEDTGAGKTINITSPESKTYNFKNGDTYAIDLDVSADFDADSWWYTLIDKKYNKAVNENVIFFPNTIIGAVRGANKLKVYANDSKGRVYEKSMDFFVFVPNSAPLIEHIDSEIFVCEGSYLSYYFNVTDVDEELNVIESQIEPQETFYISQTGYRFPYRQSHTQFNIFSKNMSKKEAAKKERAYERVIYVTDGEYVDSIRTNITVIEINNAPKFKNIRVETAVWVKGENNSFYKKIEVEDTEDGNQDSGNLNFNADILNSSGRVDLFNITQNGIINFPLDETALGIYKISVCAADKGLQRLHQNISLCSQTGKSIKTCKDFSLTVTNENKQPTITSHYYETLNFNASATENLYFNITMYDPEETPLDSYWYVDNVLKKYTNGVKNGNFDEFKYSFSCGTSGKHKIKAGVTDGLLNDSIEWELYIKHKECSIETARCKEKWVCEDSGVCQNLDKSLVLGILSKEDYKEIKENCKIRGWTEGCGFQIRECFDVNICNTNYTKPSKIHSCLYTENPSCYDKIKNCHDGECEVLTDCGGSCLACPTCSDNIKNQGETDVDCGGPCPACFEKPIPKHKISLRPFLIIIVIVISIFILIRIFNIFKIRKEIQKEVTFGN